MLSREKAEKILKRKFLQIAVDKNKTENFYTFCKDKYNIDKMTTGSYLNEKIILSKASTFLLYAFMDGAEHCLNTTNKSEIPAYFTDNEINTFANQKLEIKPLFPIVFENIVKINENQWIGSITAKTILKLMDNNLIHYNTETQRAVTVVTKNGEEQWKITISDNAVGEISRSMLNGTFISNMITLNIPEDDFDANFYFDEKKHRFVIKALDRFDVTDGFHRIIAMQRSQSSNNDFDYNMEVRITNFSKDRACHFIRQEDLKTHMSKMQSKSMDAGDPANIVAIKLNENPLCNISGMVTKYTGQIKYIDLSEAIRRFYFPTKKSQTDPTAKAQAIKVSQSLTKNINALTELYPDLLEKTYSFMDLCVIIYTFHSGKKKGQSEREMYVEIYNVLKYLETYDEKKISVKASRSSTKKISDTIDRIKGEMYDNV